MKTKDKIKKVSRELFNEKGFKNVTLREVAKELSISYGNVTYHFKTKEELIVSLFEDMQKETEAIQGTMNANNLLEGILNGPKITFDISMKYAFLYVDFIEIKRSYPDLVLQMEQTIKTRKVVYLHILTQLQLEGTLRQDLSPNDLDYLMDLSGAIRTFFFINLNPTDFSDPDLKDRYVNYINKLLFPYLTKEGIVKYESCID